MDRINIINPTGERKSIPTRNLDKALSYGYRLADAGQDIAVINPNGERKTIPTDNLQKALGYGYKLATPSFTDYTQAAVQGVATGIGKIADTAVATGNLINTGVGRAGSYLADKAGANELAEDFKQFSDESADYAKDYWKNDKIAATASDALDTGLNHYTGVRMAKGAGEMAASLPVASGLGVGVKVLTKAGGAAKLPWVSKINNFLETPITKTNAAIFAGAGAGSEAMNPDDPLQRLAGGLLGGITAHAGTASLKSLKEIGGLLSREKLYESLVKRGDTTLDTEAIKAMKDIGGKLDAKTIYKDNDVAAYIERVFPAKAYGITAKNADKDIINNIESSLNKALGEMPKGSDQHSTVRSLTSEADSIISQLYISSKERNKALYEKAFSLIKAEDPLPSPANSVSAAEQVFKTTYAPSTAGTTKTGQGITSSAVAKIIKEWSDKKVVSYEEMVAQLRALNEQRRIAGSGYKDLFKSVENAIKKDIQKVNPNFLKEYETVSKDYATNIVPFIQLDAARALLTGEKPNFIWEHMNTSTNREEVKKALAIGGENGQKLFDTIKRVKAQAVIIEKIQQDGAFKPNKFIELFTQLKPEDDIIDLIGKSSYNKIKDNTLVLARKLNDIQTKTATVDNSAIGTALNKGGATASSATLGATAGFAAGNIPGAVAGAATGAYAKHWLAQGFAKAAQNPQVIERLIVAAEKNNDRQFINILTRAGDYIGNSLKKATDSTVNSPAVKYPLLQNIRKGLNFNTPFDRDDFIREIQDSTDRGPVLLSPEEMKELRKKK